MELGNHNYCIIMAGGIGTRFWPMSRTEKPKQFIDILGTGETLIQQTFKRFARIFPVENIYVVTNSIYNDLVKEQLPLMSSDQILLEPSRRNTAPCVAYAAFKIHERDAQAKLVVAPSDHIILKEDEFVKTISEALEETNSNCDWLLTLGIKPTRPDTGYGYIQIVEGKDCSSNPNIFKVKTFTEKPNLQIAESFVASGDFLWNSGIFIWRAEKILQEFKKFLPETYEIFSEGRSKYNTPDEKEFLNEAYGLCKSVSIDYGILEKAEDVFVYAADFGWSDLGTWGSLYDTLKKDKEGNSIIGGNVMTYNTSKCIVNVPDKKLVAIRGLDDFIVVEDGDTLLICPKEDEQYLRNIVNDIKINKGDKYI